MANPTPLRIGMAGYAFMGAAHSHAWRTAPRFFDLPLAPEMTALAGRNADAAAAAAARAGLEFADRNGLAPTHRAGGHRPRRHLHSRRHARRDRHCRPGSRQARAVREAAGELGGGGRSMARPPHGPPPRAGSTPCAATATAAPRHWRWPSGFVDSGGSGTSGTCAHSTSRTGSATQTPRMTWRLDKVQVRLRRPGDIGAHIIDAAQWITGQQIIRGLGADGDLRPENGPLAGDLVGLGGHGDLDAGRPGVRLRSTTRRSSRARFDGGPIGVFEATRLRWDAGTPCGWRSTAARAPSPSTSRTMNILDSSTTPRRRRPDAGFRTDHGHRARAPLHGSLVAHRPRPRLRARLHAPGGRPRRQLSRTAASRPVFADALQVQRVLAAPWKPARATTRRYKRR